MMKRFLFVCFVGVGALLATVFSVSAASSYDEGADGDLSDDRMAPTVVTFTVGSNTVSGSAGGGDRDYLTFEVPVGHQLSSLNLTSYSGGSSSFIGIVSGTQVMVDPAMPSAAGLLGYHLFKGADVGNDILPSMGTGANAMGFTPPLPAGNYAIWIQDTAGAESYGFDFVVEAVPPMSGPQTHDEAIDGDLSDDRLIPTEITLGMGSNVISGTAGGGDLDYVTFEVPVGYLLANVNLTAYSGSRVSFIGIVSGTQVMVDPAMPAAEDLLGYHLFGEGDIGNDILPSMGTGANAMGFTPPLPAGNYAIWIQDTAGAESYQFDFVLIPTHKVYLPMIVGN